MQKNKNSSIDNSVTKKTGIFYIICFFLFALGWWFIFQFFFTPVYTSRSVIKAANNQNHILLDLMLEKKGFSNPSSFFSITDG
ncbi:hypothetical protein, partial [Endozoicomonas atrinae]|uniref:hypothetical protein n=1 Tax=Endozoicomonas atrinae TaxID=1333660 RepID=UPI001112CD8D